MENNEENSSIIEREETADIVERENVSAGLTRIAILFVALSIVFSLHSLKSIFYFITDNSIPLVNCPQSYELDAPVILKPVRDESAKVQDRWIRGFMRRFVLAQFPRVGKDVEKFFTYASNHSKGNIKEKYDSLLIDKVELTSLVQTGFYYRFYPKFGENSEMRIRVTENPKIYVVEIDGYLVKKMGTIQERYTPTLRFVVEMDKPTMTNPEGLYVIEGNIEQITDYVSGTKENL